MGGPRRRRIRQIEEWNSWRKGGRDGRERERDRKSAQISMNRGRCAVECVSFRCERFQVFDDSWLTVRERVYTRGYVSGFACACRRDCVCLHVCVCACVYPVLKGQLSQHSAVSTEKVR